MRVSKKMIKDAKHRLIQRVKELSAIKDDDLPNEFIRAYGVRVVADHPNEMRSKLTTFAIDEALPNFWFE